MEILSYKLRMLRMTLIRYHPMKMPDPPPKELIPPIPPRAALEYRSMFENPL